MTYLYIVFQVALLTEDRYTGNYFFRCGACAEGGQPHTGDDASKHGRGFQCVLRGAWVHIIKPALGRRQGMLRASRLPARNHKMKEALSGYLTAIGALLYIDGELLNP